MKNNQCPEIPFFGARYPDARCIDGYLWDLDSCGSDPDVFYKGGDDPCPFCKPKEFVENYGQEVHDYYIKTYSDE